MTRMEAELQILEHIKAISEIYSEYDPEGDLLKITLWNHHKGFNGNDYGDWKTSDVECWTGREAKKKIGFHAWIDIDDEDYQTAKAKDLAEHPEDEDQYEIKWEYQKGFWAAEEKEYD